MQLLEDMQAKSVEVEKVISNLHGQIEEYVHWRPSDDPFDSRDPYTLRVKCFGAINHARLLLTEIEKMADRL